MMKICSRCKIEKQDDEFRVRVENRRGRPTFSYLNNECKKCDAERANIYYTRKKNDPSFKRANCERVKKYRNSNADKIRLRKTTKEFAEKHAKLNLASYYRMKDVINAKLKIKRQSPEYKAMMKAYRDKNKEKIYQQEIITKKRYHKKNVNGLTDKYAINLLKTQNKEVTPQSITHKKTQVLVSRIKDKLRQIKTIEKQN